MSTHQTKSRRMNKKRRNLKRSFQVDSGTTRVSVIPLNLGLAPPRTRVWLGFSKTVLVTNVGLNTANIRLVPTNAYDVDPTIGSTAVPGFTEWGGLYRFYRVVASRIKVSFMNNEAFPGTCGVIPVNYDPTANHVAATTVQFLSQANSHDRPVGSITGMSTCVINHGATTATFGGASNLGVLDPYTAPTSGSSAPTNNWYWDVLFYPAQAIVSGCLVHIKMKVNVEFLELNSPSV